MATDRLEGSILNILAYFSVFEFPLEAADIRRLLPPQSNVDELESSLMELVGQGVIYRTGQFYSLDDNPDLVRRKLESYTLARQLLPTAARIGRFLCKFPYVEGIGISGGLSKMCAQPGEDIDFFIITRANRLWVARTLMHLYKKLTFLAGKQHYHCMNYYIDEEALRLNDQNIYTAIETITLIPVCGQALERFFQSNEWVGDWFAEYRSLMKRKQETRPRSWLKNWVEWLLAGRLGNRLDDFLMKKTAKRWEKKERKMLLNHKGRVMSLRTGKHFAWSNPGSFQQKTLEKYHLRIAELRRKWPCYFLPVNASFEE